MGFYYFRGEGGANETFLGETGHSLPARRADSTHAWTGESHLTSPVAWEVIRPCWANRHVRAWCLAREGAPVRTWS